MPEHLKRPELEHPPVPRETEALETNPEQAAFDGAQTRDETQRVETPADVAMPSAPTAEIQDTQPEAAAGEREATTAEIKDYLNHIIDRGEKSIPDSQSAEGFLRGIQAENLQNLKDE